MPGFDRDQVAIDNTVENRRLGSILLTVGWILLWMDAGLGIFFFISLRNGSWFWPIWLGIEGALGLVLVVMGTRYRRAVGPPDWAVGTWSARWRNSDRKKRKNGR